MVLIQCSLIPWKIGETDAVDDSHIHHTGQRSYYCSDGLSFAGPIIIDHMYFLLTVEGKADTVEYLCGNEITFSPHPYLCGALSKALMIMQLIINKTQ